nr:basic helix-loop-helix transcription factor [Loropetalum chinense var. rubrum]
MSFLGGEELLLAAMEQSIDDAYYNAMCSGVSLSALLSSNREKPQRSEYNIGSSSISFPVSPSIDPATFSFFSEEFPALSQKQIAERSMNDDQGMRSIDFMEKLKMPKVEPLDNAEITYKPANDSFKLVSKGLDPIPNSNFHHLPDLRSLEQVHDEFSVAETSQKRVRSYSSSSESYTLDAIVRSFKLSNYLGSHKAREAPVPPVIPQSALARQRRQRISDKTRCLQKLMPWDKKMDMATMLEEAYKYIKFLQAQINVLQSMTCESSFSVQVNSSGNIGSFGGLGKLNRQQLLQVLVNSPVAQTMLYSQECCVVSVEQLALLEKIAERRILMQHMPLDPTKLS